MTLFEKKKNMQEREFDLNIEKILENWEVHHAIREIIANALDEQILTNTKDIQIIKRENSWRIIDFGRGLNYHHLTQNESEEKLNNDKLIGRFGVGLKDALATLYRHGIKVKIMSKYGVITLMESSKVGFDDIITLHAKISSTADINMRGTEFILEGCKDSDITEAKSQFLSFSNANILEKTQYGEIVEKATNVANIYINGVKVAEEPNFLFSYNITSLTKQLKKSLNRERTNVGRSAYTDRIKAILTSCHNKKVIDLLVKDLQQFSSGDKHDELSWNDVALYASKKMSEINSNVTFITSDDLLESPSIIDDMKSRGYNPVIVSGTLSKKMDNYNRESKDGDIFTTTNKFVLDMKDRLSFKFIDIKELSSKERNIYEKIDDILQLIGGKPVEVKEIRVSESIFESEFLQETVGLWEPVNKRIIIKRNQLKSLSAFAATLLHECAHAKSGADDVSRSFEQELTKIIGMIAEQYLI